MAGTTYRPENSSGWQRDCDRTYGSPSSDQKRGFMDRAGDEVSSSFGDEDARRRRNMDSHRGKGPKGRSDDRIRGDVRDLAGEVATRNEKRMAEDCMERVADVKHVQNSLSVQTKPLRGEGEGEAQTVAWSGLGPDPIFPAE